jgi:hypothetical protein
VDLNDPQTRAFVSDVAKEAVRETFQSLGVDARHPGEVQRDMAYLRDMRKATTSLRNHGILAAVTLCVTGIMGAMWVGILSYFRGN